MSDSVSVKSRSISTPREALHCWALSTIIIAAGAFGIWLLLL